MPYISSPIPDDNQWNFIGDGMNLPITNMFDVDGDPTTDPEQATTLVAMLPDGQWFACECWPHEIIKRSLSQLS